MSSYQQAPMRTERAMDVTIDEPDEVEAIAEFETAKSNNNRSLTKTKLALVGFVALLAFILIIVLISR